MHFGADRQTEFVYRSARNLMPGKCLDSQNILQERSSERMCEQSEVFNNLKPRPWGMSGLHGSWSGAVNGQNKSRRGDNASKLFAQGGLEVGMATTNSYSTLSSTCAKEHEHMTSVASLSSGDQVLEFVRFGFKRCGVNWSR